VKNTIVEDIFILNKFDNMSTAEIETISNALCIYTSMLADDPNKFDRKIEAAIILDLLNEIDNRNKDRLAAINAELQQIDSELNIDDLNNSMTFDDFINSFDDDDI